MNHDNDVKTYHNELLKTLLGDLSQLTCTKAYIEFLERMVRHESLFKWFAYTGWIITTLLYWLAMERVI